MKGRTYTAVLLLLLMTLFSVTASAYTVEEFEYEDYPSTFAYSGEIDQSYAVGTSNVTQFSGVANKLPYGVSYVYWRSGQYTYHMAYSKEMELNGTTFTAPEVTLITYTTSTGYQSQATWEVETETDFTLTANNYMVYSDLGNYPDFTEREGVHYVELTTVMLATAMLWYLYQRMRNAVRRRGMDAR